MSSDLLQDRPHWDHWPRRQLFGGAAVGKGYGCSIKRRATASTLRIDHLYQDPHENDPRLVPYGDLTDSTNLIRIVQQVQPDEIYNLGAQSHVAVALKAPNTLPTAMH